MNKIALSALSTSEEKIGSGHVLVAAYPCISNALSNGFKTSINNLIRKRISSSIGNALNATFSTTNPCPNTTAIAVNISILNKTGTLNHIHVGKFVERKEELIALIIARKFATLKNASLVIMKEP